MATCVEDQLPGQVGVGGLVEALGTNGVVDHLVELLAVDVLGAGHGVQEGGEESEEGGCHPITT